MSDPLPVLLEESLIVEFGAPLLIAFEAGLQILSAAGVFKIPLSDILAC